ncbi:hypothetical protein ADUPG1_011182 [Aduncisulcus paluster]|uniref:Uncharacterized protein n=1 Tax=Aduncisulcus paluster TaxID=2918883 RepID=A0ABQ5JUN9_9EUKA|nr:hypothetical protein ADUPG1_011182 [Aduncisulcus paluster]
MTTHKKSDLSFFPFSSKEVKVLLFTEKCEKSIEESHKVERILASDESKSSGVTEGLSSPKMTSSPSKSTIIPIYMKNFQKHLNEILILAAKMRAEVFKVYCHLSNVTHTCHEMKDEYTKGLKDMEAFQPSFQWADLDCFDYQKILTDNLRIIFGIPKSISSKSKDHEDFLLKTVDFSSQLKIYEKQRSRDEERPLSERKGYQYDNQAKKDKPKAHLSIFGEVIPQLPAFAFSLDDLWQHFSISDENVPFDMLSIDKIEDLAAQPDIYIRTSRDHKTRDLINFSPIRKRLEGLIQENKIIYNLLVRYFCHLRECDLFIDVVQKFLFPRTSHVESLLSYLHKRAVNTLASQYKYICFKRDRRAEIINMEIQARVDEKKRLVEMKRKEVEHLDEREPTRTRDYFMKPVKSLDIVKMSRTNVHRYRSPALET